LPSLCYGARASDEGPPTGPIHEDAGAEFDRLVSETWRINEERREHESEPSPPPDDGVPFWTPPPTGDEQEDGPPQPPDEDDVDREERDLMSRIVDGPALALEPEPTVEWIVEDLIPIEHLTIVSGNGGTGKTTLIAMLMIAMQIGGDWLDMKVKQGDALFTLRERRAPLRARAPSRVYRRPSPHPNPCRGLRLRAAISPAASILGGVKNRAWTSRPMRWATPCPRAGEAARAARHGGQERVAAAALDRPTQRQHHHHFLFSQSHGLRVSRG
jgi:hypothetical protein